MKNVSFATKVERFVMGLIVISIIPIVAFAWSFGWLDGLEELYEEFYTNTIGEPYSDRFRDEPILFALPAGIISAILYSIIPRQYLGRGVVMFVAFNVGLVAGHLGDRGQRGPPLPDFGLRLGRPATTSAR